jgi:stage II sporulation protein AB (anti-sigma F factor)
MDSRKTVLKNTDGTEANRMYLEVDSRSENEAFVRIAVAAFCTRLDPTLEEVEDIKTAVSEAVTNAVIHGYQGKNGIITIQAEIIEDVLEVKISDTGCGISNIEQAREPLFTTKPDAERSGMGFSFMEIFMDELEVLSEPDVGTTIVMRKRIGQPLDE